MSSSATLRMKTIVVWTIIRFIFITQARAEIPIDTELEILAYLEEEKQTTQQLQDALRKTLKSDVISDIVSRLKELSAIDNEHQEDPKELTLQETLERQEAQKQKKPFVCTETWCMKNHKKIVNQEQLGELEQAREVHLQQTLERKVTRSPPKSPQKQKKPEKPKRPKKPFFHTYYKVQSKNMLNPIQEKTTQAREDEPTGTAIISGDEELPRIDLKQNTYQYPGQQTTTSNEGITREAIIEDGHGDNRIELLLLLKRLMSNA